jgi:hypothetical protein
MGRVAFDVMGNIGATDDPSLHLCPLTTPLIVVSEKDTHVRGRSGNVGACHNSSVVTGVEVAASVFPVAATVSPRGLLEVEQQAEFLLSSHGVYRG